MKCLIYVTKSKPWLFFDKNINYYSLSNKKIDNDLNGKVIAEFDGEVEVIHNEYDNSLFYTDKCGGFRLQFRSCLDCRQLATYLNGKTGYAIHINDLKIFDKPRALNSYSKVKSYKDGEIKVARWEFDENLNLKKIVDEFIPHYHFEKIRSPQNMMKVYDKNGNEYILISIRPEWACKILNGEKTIEVRKQVLNCMKGD